MILLHMLNMKHILFFVILVLPMAIAIRMHIQYQWKYIDYVWDSPEEKQQAIDNGDYNASSCVLYDVDKSEDGRIFVTSIRNVGVPASVMTVTKNQGDGGPLLRPYPDWSWYRGTSCDGIISVYRVFIKCNHLFILDCGKIGDDMVCPAKLLIFDLSNDALIKRIEIPDNVAANENGTSTLTELVVSITHCWDFQNNMVVYMSDTGGYGLVIYNARSSRFCRIESDSMKPTDTYFTINNQSFSLDDGILGSTLVNGDLYYAALSGDNIYKVDSAKIKECLLNEAEFDAITQLGTLPGQTAPIASHRCAIFFSDIPETSVMCADTSKEINPSNVNTIAKDPVNLQFPSGMKIIKRTRHHSDFLFDNDLTILTNRYQRVATKTLNLNETNFRILSINLMDIWMRTHCFHSCM